MGSTFVLAALLEKRYMEKNEMTEIPKQLKRSVKDYKKANREKVTEVFSDELNKILSRYNLI